MERRISADRDAETLCAARRVLVAGRGACAAATAIAACDLAEDLGAAVDFGGADTAQASGPTIARIGAVTADPLELRDRADLVIVWFCDPSVEAPGFPRHVMTPATAAGRPRLSIAVGPREVATSAATDRHLPLSAEFAVDLARLLHATVAGHPLPEPPQALMAAREAVVAAIASAECVAFVTSHRDTVGLVPWSLVGLVRAVAEHRPAFEVPLEPAATAATVCTWRYGAPGAIASADRSGAAFRPAECDAVRLVARGETDCVVAVGRLPEALETAVVARGDAVAVIRIPEDEASARARLAELLAAVRAAAAGEAP